MKVSSWMEVFPFDALFIGKKKAIVEVKMPHGKIEKHAYPVNEKNRLVIHKEEEKEMYNPIVKGRETYDMKGRLLFRWVYGEPYAFSLFDFKTFEERVQNDEVAEQAYDAGKIMGRLESRGGGRKNAFDNPVLWVAVAILLVLLFNIVLTYLGFANHGVDFLGATPGA